VSHIEEINDPGRLDDYRLLWNALLPETAGATFFQSLDWFQTYWRYFGEAQRLRVLVVHGPERPLGILPLVVRREKTRMGSLRVLTYPLHDWGTFYGPIGPYPTATLLAGLRHVRRTARDWEMLDLRWVDRDGVDQQRTPTAMAQVGLPGQAQAWTQAPMIELDGSWQDYWRGRQKKYRHNVERCRRRLERQGKLELIRYRPEGSAHGDDDPRWDLYDACLGIAKCSWQGSSGNGTTLCHRCVCDYLRDAHVAAVRAGAMDLCLLTLGGRPIAFIYHYRYEGRIYGLRKGYEPELGCLGPGIVLQQMVLEDSFRRGDRSYDMGAGSLDSKRPWQTSLATSYRYTHFPLASPRTQLIRAKRWLVERFAGPQVACM
jgi:CelD/BcsL family acetyltransferase involved in cellulose biosynthesis